MDENFQLSMLTTYLVKRAVEEGLITKSQARNKQEDVSK